MHIFRILAFYGCFVAAFSSLSFYTFKLFSSLERCSFSVCCLFLIFSFQILKLNFCNYTTISLISLSSLFRPFSSNSAFALPSGINFMFCVLHFVSEIFSAFLCSAFKFGSVGRCRYNKFNSVKGRFRFCCCFD